MNLGSISRNTHLYKALRDRLEADPAAEKKKPSTPAAKAAEPARTDGSNTSDGNRTGTGKVIPHAQYKFNPFDQKSWDVSNAKGSQVDTHV